jgi:hypothetical protein
MDHNCAFQLPGWNAFLEGFLKEGWSHTGFPDLGKESWGSHTHLFPGCFQRHPPLCLTGEDLSKMPDFRSCSSDQLIGRETRFLLSSQFTDEEPEKQEALTINYLMHSQRDRCHTWSLLSVDRLYI